MIVNERGVAPAARLGALHVGDGDAWARDGGRRCVRGRARGGDRAGGDLRDHRGDGRGHERAAAPEAEEVGAQVVGALVAVLGILGERAR